MKKVAVALSGGVDSAAAALLLIKKGYLPEGFSFRLTQDESGISRSAEVCAALGIKHHILDYRQAFEEEVIAPFTGAYARALTPNPCVLCNAAIKFGRFPADAARLGFEKISTGHWARVTVQNGSAHFARAKNTKQDQSYALCLVSPGVIERCLLPLGDVSADKDELRRMARDAGLPVWGRPDSQDICFVPNNDHGAFIVGRNAACPAGRYLDEHGRVLGPNRGICRLTVGQRKGLGIALGRPAFVLETRPDGDAVLSCDENLLNKKNILVKDCVFAQGRPAAPFWALVQIRYSHRAAPALVTPGATNGVRIEFEEPQRAPTPGQAAAFFEGDILKGGGIIAEACE